MGFRWAERPRRGGRGLWHPELHIGINIGSGGTPSDLAALSNVLIVINDLDLEQRAQSSLKVIGIEDLIAAQVAGCLMLRTPFSEAASLTQVLIALAREGVGGRFRAGYLQRRVTWDTDGAVVLEGQFSGSACLVCARVDVESRARDCTLASRDNLTRPFRARRELDNRVSRTQKRGALGRYCGQRSGLR